MTQTGLHVIFGTGTVGNAVMRALVERGQRVRMINRSGKPSFATGSTLPANVEIVSGDAYSADQVARLTEGAAVVYQCAQPAYHEWQEKFPPLQAAIIDGVARTGGKLIVMENLYGYGDPQGKPITQGLPINPHTKKGQVRAAMSASLFNAHAQGKIRAAAGRASDFFGEGYDVTADQVFYPALAGKTVQGIGNLDLPHSFSYTRDVGAGLVILGERDDALGQAWHLPVAPAVTQRQLLETVVRLSGTSSKIGAINGMMMRIGGLFMPAAREMIEMMYEFNQPFVLDDTPFRTTFGVSATPLEEALRNTLAWFRANPKPAH